MPVSIAVALIIALRVDEAKSPFARRLDWPGFVLLTVGLSTLVYGLIRAGEDGWSDAGYQGLARDHRDQVSRR